MINPMERRQSGFSKVAGGLGKVLGGVGGFIVGGPAGAALGANIGGAVGDTAGALTSKGPASQGLQPMQRRMDVMDQTPLQDVINAKAALPEAPPAIQAQAAPILDEALKRAQPRRFV